MRVYSANGANTSCPAGIRRARPASTSPAGPTPDSQCSRWCRAASHPTRTRRGGFVLTGLVVLAGGRGHAPSVERAGVAVLAQLAGTQPVPRRTRTGAASSDVVSFPDGSAQVVEDPVSLDTTSTRLPDALAWAAAAATSSTGGVAAGVGVGAAVGAGAAGVGAGVGSDGLVVAVVGAVAAGVTPLAPRPLPTQPGTHRQHGEHCRAGHLPVPPSERRKTRQPRTGHGNRHPVRAPGKAGCPPAAAHSLATSAARPRRLEHRMGEPGETSDLCDPARSAAADLPCRSAAVGVFGYSRLTVLSE
jgi:hypothetical protein